MFRKELTTMLSPDTQQTKWLVLAEPRHGHVTHAGYFQLLAAIDQGWQIIQPIHQRLRSTLDDELSFRVILKDRENTRVQMIKVSDDPLIRKFISENRLWVTTS
jgi:hypothetical protein